MTETKLYERDINIIRQMLKNHSTLHPRIFNKQNEMYPYIREQLLNMVDFAIESVFKFFPKVKLLDIILSGSVCGYTYTHDSDLDIFIVIDDLVENRSKVNGFVLDNISKYYAYQDFKPFIFGHPIDFGFSNISKYMRFYDMAEGVKKIYSHNTYSLLNNGWIGAPERLEYAFTPEQLYENYLKFKDDMDKFVESLPHANEEFLTSSSISKLKRTLVDLKFESFIAKEHDIMHEYSLVYNTYRVAKRLKLIASYHKYADASQNYLMQKAKK